MSDQFFSQPILNSPYSYPGRHWKLDDTGQPTQEIVESRREVKFITPIPKSRQRGGQKSLELGGTDDSEKLEHGSQQYELIQIINQMRKIVDRWRELPNSKDWKVSPVTERLLKHWRHHEFSTYRPFFCQIEAVETAIWLAEVAPNTKEGRDILDYLNRANEEANPELFRIALKLATGAGKTTVMAMLIAWQTLNKKHSPQSQKFTNGFLIITPGITIKDRLRVLLPNDPNNYYDQFELVPQELINDMGSARVVITNYHAFKHKETFEGAKGTKSLLQGRDEEPDTKQTDGQMLRDAIQSLMGLKNIVVINDEAHHCYREKQKSNEETTLSSEEKKEAKENTEAARLWINGIETVKAKIGVNVVYDLSATPFFLRGSGYAEGTIFPWTMSDFSLMDAIECGIVKLPRVPVADNVPTDEMPMYRDLWEHIGKKMPKAAYSKNRQLDPEQLPLLLKNALEALYGHYEKVYKLWEQEGIGVPPCFIIVCNNTATSKLVYDYIGGYFKENENDPDYYRPGKLELFKNYNEHGEAYPRPRTILVDSVQLESGDSLDPNFRHAANEEIERFKDDLRRRGTMSQKEIENLKDSDLLREVMNTVGKRDKLGESVRCVVSVSMLTEGWDANTVTHILGVRAFGTQLLCEQVVGRALRRQSYDVNEENLFNVEYADILGIPFDFTAKPVPSPPQKPRETVHVHAVIPDRDQYEITFPNVVGYRVELPNETVEAEFTQDSRLFLTPELVGPTITHVEGLIGEGVQLDVQHLKDVRTSTLVLSLTQLLILEKWRQPGEEPRYHLFSPLKRIVRQWLDEYLLCTSSTYPAQLMYRQLGEMAADRITAAINRAMKDENPILAVLDPYNPRGSTRFVNFPTSRLTRYETKKRCHLNWAILDSTWEGQFCRIAEFHPRVLSYTKNHNNRGRMTIPYNHKGEEHLYVPDYIVHIDDGHGLEDPLNLIVEVKGMINELVPSKNLAVREYWVPGVNNLKTYGRWAYAIFEDVYGMPDEFANIVEEHFEKMVEETLDPSKSKA